MGVEIKNIGLCLESVYQISNFHFWTDSSIVLCWINNTKNVYKAYVQHHLIRVRELIDVRNLLLVPSKMNLADAAMQGLTPLKLVDTMLLRHGPGFLTLPKTSWPHLPVGNNFNSYNINGISNNGMLCILSNINNTVNKDVQFSIYNDSRLLEIISVSYNLVISEISSNTTTGLLGCCNGVCLSNAIDITRFSLLLRLLCITTWVAKFESKVLNKIKNKNKNIPDKTDTVLTGEEIS